MMGPSRERPFFFQAGRTTKPAHGLSATGEVKPILLPAGSPEHSSASVCSGSSCSGSGLQFGLGIGLGSGLGSGSGPELGSGFGLGLGLELGLGVRTWLSLYEAMYMSPSGPQVIPTGPRTTPLA